MCKIPRLFEIMKEKDIKANKLSEIIKVSTGNISDWKSGRSTPSSEKLILLAQFFNVTTDYLLGLDEEPNKHSSSRENLSEQEVRMLKAFRNLTPEDRLIEIGRAEGIAEKYSPEQKENAEIKNAEIA